MSARVTVTLHYTPKKLATFFSTTLQKTIITLAKKAAVQGEKPRLEKRRLKELSLVFVDTRGITALNKKFLRHHRSTDVIAFPSEESGDIFISVPDARRNAKTFRVSFEEEMKRLAVHGVLHLRGYSDKSPRLKKRMWGVQETLVRGGASS